MNSSPPTTPPGPSTGTTYAATAWEPYGRLLEHAEQGRPDAVASVLVSDGSVEEIAAYDLLRHGGFPDAEAFALEAARGRVLDLGAGAGPHSLALQERARLEAGSGLEVFAVDVCPQAVDVMRRRGVQHAEVATAETLLAREPSLPPFDTLLLMMNGLGLAGTLDRLTPFLTRCRQLISPSGQILTDLASPAGISDAPNAADPRPYPGEVKFQFLYDGLLGASFPWLFLDPQTLRRHALRAGLQTQVVFSDGQGQYLVRMVPVV
ncbi:MAG: class I SAM-dependent methyltransferase [Acidobacteriota bacterium]